MTEEELMVWEMVETVKIARVLPTDIVVVSAIVPSLSPEQRKQIQETIRKYFPANQILVLPGEVSLEIKRVGTQSGIGLPGEKMRNRKTDQERPRLTLEDRKVIARLLKAHRKSRPIVVEGLIEQILPFKRIDELSKEIPTLPKEGDRPGPTC